MRCVMRTVNTIIFTRTLLYNARLTYMVTECHGSVTPNLIPSLYLTSIFQISVTITNSVIVLIIYVVYQEYISGTH